MKYIKIISSITNVHGITLTSFWKTVAHKDAGTDRTSRFVWKKLVRVIPCTFLIIFSGFFLTAYSAPIVKSTTAIKWYRTSAERKAIYREVFFMANNIIKQKVLKEKLKPHTWGVIFDIDETILDNSQWNYEHDIKGKSQEWDAFAAEGVSLRTPGAKEIMLSIHHLGGYVNLVTNRNESLRAITEKNLHQQGLYYDQVLLKSRDLKNWYADKNPRFKAIIKGVKPSQFPAQNIIAWFGDNIQDFPKLKQSKISKKNGESAAFDKFGVQYFALPNPMYGSWEYI